MVVQLKDKVRFFPNWEHSVNRDAVFVYQDVTQDGKPELITILTVATGTGLNIEEVHVLDSETLEEMNIESSLDYIQQHVTSKVTPEEIEIIVNNKNYSYSTMEEVGDSPWLFDEIAFGSIIKYEIDQQGLKVHVTGQVSAGGFIGNIVLTYEYKDDMFKVSKIEFEK
ncbi:hypothetical protein [Caldalkalibacillus mannanilyticus]|uniref:hypothetical protein n=1 Tax=Caldalkalibacillus mannanilyticus TaxID=1418 RepID=UPI000468070A|nr:hypothetical protein [Caldalkalibacillus mannanilyticus]